MITRFTAAAIAAAGLSLLSIAPAGAAGRGFNVLHHERLAGLSIERRVVAGSEGQRASRATRLRFQALGRVFDISLAPNDRLLANLDAHQRADVASLELYRGSLGGRPDTWARVSVLNGDLYALVWDGSELYAIEPSARLAGRLAEGDDGGNLPVVFRVSDVQGIFADEVLVGASTSARSYPALVSELASEVANGVPTRRLDLGLVADAEFAASNSDAEAELLLRANYVDGIYSEQLGLQVNVTGTDVTGGEPDAFSSSDPQTLLRSVSSYRSRSASMRADALVHLYTGRQLDGDIVGIAYMNGVCDASEGVGLTQASSSVFHDALITAHEIGHNLGAPHDAEAGSPCESTPATYLMAPQLSGSDQLSQCSIQHIAATLARATCLGPAYAGDVRISLSAPDDALLGDDVPVRVAVENLGNEASANVVVAFQSSLGGIIESGTSDSGHDCAVADGELHCAIATLAAGAHEDIEVAMSGTRAGTVTLMATAYASNDTNPANNAAARSLELTPAVVLAVGVQPDTVSLGAGDTAAVTVSVLNDSMLTATAVNVDLSSPFELSDLVLAGAVCSRIDGNTPHYRCSLATLRGQNSQMLHAVIHAPDQVRDGTIVSGLLSATATAAEPLARAGSNSGSAVVRAYSAVVDLAASVSSAPARVQAGASTHVVVQLRNLGPDAAPSAQLAVQFPADLAAVGVADDHSACRVASARAVRCSLATFGDADSIEVDVEVVPAQAGNYGWSVSASHAGLDPNGANDVVQETMEVTAPSGTSHPASAGNSRGGGGGASWMLVALAGVGLHRRRRLSARAS